MGMAAAALYIACVQNNEKITQKDVAEAAGVTEVTVRNRYKALRKQLNLELPDQKHRLIAQFPVSPVNNKNSIDFCMKPRNSFAKENESLFLSEGDCEMSKKGETREQDRGKPQPRKKKEREDARKKKKLDRVERQKSRQAQID